MVLKLNNSITVYRLSTFKSFFPTSIISWGDLAPVYFDWATCSPLRSYLQCSISPAGIFCLYTCCWAAPREPQTPGRDVVPSLGSCVVLSSSLLSLLAFCAFPCLFTFPASLRFPAGEPFACCGLLCHVSLSLYIPLPLVPQTLLFFLRLTVHMHTPFFLLFS